MTNKKSSQSWVESINSADVFPEIDFSPWKYPFLWGTGLNEETLLEPLEQIYAFLASKKSKLHIGALQLEIADLESDLLPITTDAVGVNITAQPQLFQLYACELAYALAVAIPCMGEAEALLIQARKALTDATEAFFDEAGMPSVDVLPYFRFIFASWTRLRILEQKSKINLFPERETLLYEWLTRNAILLTNPDGTQRFSQEVVLVKDKPEAELFKAALSLDPDEDDAHQAAAALPWIPRYKAQAGKGVLMTEPSVYSEWSQVAVEQNGWDWNNPNVSIAYKDDIMETLFNLGGKRVFSGPWGTDVTVNDKTLKSDGEWQNVCWDCEDDYAYLEMELPLENGASLGRTVCMAHEDQLLLMADMVKFDKPAPKSRRIVCTSYLPLNGGFGYIPSEESTEGILAGGRNSYTVFPLALSEWRESAQGALDFQNNTLIYSTQMQGNGLFAPLIFDLNPKRLKSAYTWRRLTVTETGGEIVSSDKAVGYRLQIRDKNWLLYQSIVPPASRAVLGCHLVYQTLFARFIKGEIDRIVAIE